MVSALRSVPAAAVISRASHRTWWPRKYSRQRTPSSNQKLKKDIARLASDPARHRYVFFAAPNYARGRQAHLETVAGVEVHCVEL